MTDMQTTPNQVPPEVAELWTELHAEALVRYETLRAQTEGVSVGRMVALGIPVLLIVLVVVLGGLYSAGAVMTPAFVCGASEGLCTPTPTLEPTATPQPTYTPFPTPTPLPPTETPTPTPTPTITPTPLPCGERLQRCKHSDFAAVMEQISPLEQPIGTCDAPDEDVQTEFVFTNIGNCMLTGGELEDINGQKVEGIPPVLNPGEAVTLTYQWEPLTPTLHTMSFEFFHIGATCTYWSLESDEFVLSVDLTDLDADSDGFTDACDCCRNTAGSVSGCPDRDGDGWVDVSRCSRLRVDKCPGEPGGANGIEGCPDTDGDGVPDKDDCCPDIPGILSLSGCPDADGDGFPENNEKACPGLPATDKCPGDSGQQDENCPGCTLVCQTEYDKCEVEVCETDTGSGKETCRTEQRDCNPHQVCKCP